MSGRPFNARLTRMLSRLIRPEHRDEATGDLLEEYEKKIRPRFGHVRANLWLTSLLLRTAVASHWHTLRHRATSRPPVARRKTKGTVLMQTLMQDLKYAVRSLRKSPLFTTVAVLTLSVGMGATIAMFTVVNGVLIRELQ